MALSCGPALLVAVELQRTRERLARPALPHILRGGTSGNARLTGLTAAALLVLLAAEGATILSINSLLRPHIFIGFLLVPLVVLKMASTGWKFLRYYRADPAYRDVGPPALLLRLLGPIVALATVVLVGTGVALAAAGPGGGLLLGLHKASFVIWFGSMTLHVIGHAARIPLLTAPDLRGGEGVAGSRLRLVVLAGAIVAGAILAVATVPLIGPWTHWAGSFHGDG
jgi:hypothetical protein